MSQNYKSHKNQQEHQAKRLDNAFKKISFGQSFQESEEKKPQIYEQSNNQPQYFAREQKPHENICDYGRLQNSHDSNYQYFNDFSDFDRVLPHDINEHQQQFQQWEAYPFPENPQPKQLEAEKQQQLKKFQTSKISISRLISGSKIGKSIAPSHIKQENLSQPKIEVNKNEQELQLIPCPFCALPLLLIDLDHINACPQGTECFYCNQKYPKSLYGSHLVICQKREAYYAQKRKKYLPSQKKGLPEATQPKKQEVQKQKQKQKSPSQASIKKKIYDRPSNSIKPARITGLIQRREVPIVKKASKKIQKKQQQPKIDLIALENASKLRQQELKGLQNWQIQQIGTQVYEKIGKQRQLECPICTAEVQQGEVILRLPCNHSFHEDCLRPWLQTRSRCPTCKTRILE